MRDAVCGGAVLTGGVSRTWVRLEVLCRFGHDVQHCSAGDVHLLQTQQEQHERLLACWKLWTSPPTYLFHFFEVIV